MTNSIKKVISIVMLSVFMLLPMFGFSAAAAEKSDSYNRLSAMGFPEDYLNCISEEMMYRIISYTENYNVSDIIYKDGNEAKYNADNEALEAKTVVVSLTDKATGEPAGECVSVYWVWQKGKPFARQKDYVTLTWSNPDYLYDGTSFYAEDYLIKNGNINVPKIYTDLASIQNLGRSYELTGMSYYTDLHHFGGQNGGSAVFRLFLSHPYENEADSDNSVSLMYTHYYKMTVVLIVLAVILVSAVSAVAVIFRKKRKQKRADS